MSQDLSFILISSLGAFIQEILHWYGLRKALDDPEINRLLKSPFYWIITILTIIVSGIGSYVIFGPINNGEDILPPKVQIVLGAAFPLVFKKLVSKREELGEDIERPLTFNEALNSYLR